MNNVKTKSQFGSGDPFSDWAAVIIALLLFVRTADVLAYFSPSVLNEIVGGDVSWVYGGVSAFFIEGVALAYHFNRRAQDYVPAKIVKWALLAISGACQVFDGRLITGTLADMPEAQKMVFQIGVPILPLVVLILLFFVGRLPEADYQVPRWRGARNVFKGKWSYFLDGSSDAEESRVVTNRTSAPAHSPAPAPTPKIDLNQVDPALVQMVADELVRQSNNGNGHGGGSQDSNFQ